MLIWLGVLLATVAGVALLFRFFPGGVSTGEDWAWLARGIGLVALVSAGILTAGRIDWGEKARHAALWVGIVAVLAVGTPTATSWPAWSSGCAANSPRRRPSPPGCAS